MLDKRIGLCENMTLQLDRQYTIKSEIGRGASCIVYDAFYTDSVGLDHNVRIKECYPYKLNAERTSTGELIFLNAEDYFKAKETFVKAYIKNVEIKQKHGFTNSTVDSMEVWEFNNTVYSLMNNVEGITYGKYKDSSLHEVFSRVKSLAQIIQKYHCNGILHLDIKPENIFIPAETKEQIMLFDFDSLIEKEILQNSSEVRISCSDGFSAPELVRGRRKEICEATDIYSLGAIVFYKVFGRVPSSLDRSISAKYDFENMNFQDNRYQPKLKRKLSAFFRKTLSSTVSCRVATVDDLLSMLTELEILADVNRVSLLDNFAYSNPRFVGRKEEHDQIMSLFEDTNRIFVSGMGGIGKTEIVKHFAEQNREMFNRIIFVTFKESIISTICSDDIIITQCKWEEAESMEEYYHRKMQLLKEYVDVDDLIILDNFDVDEDEELDSLLDCRCKFLITTREDFSDYDYHQINIEPLNSEKELVQLFRINNPNSYSEAEWNSIFSLMELVEYHTMMITLLAKYLRDSLETPTELLEKMQEKEGVTNSSDLGVKHRKDKKLKKQSVTEHLLTLFDLSCFTDEELEIMMSLSVLGAVRIKREVFLNYFKNIEDVNLYLMNLIKHGWVEYDEVSSMVSLHQLILDLVYTTFEPDAEKCSNLVMSMIGYCQKEVDNNTQKRVRKELMNNLMTRLKQNEDILYGNLLYTYCDRISNNADYLLLAEKIYVDSVAKDGNVDEILVKIKELKLRNLFHIEELDLFEESDEYIEELIEKIVLKSKEYYGYASALNKGDAYMAVTAINLAKGLVQCSDGLEWSGIDTEEVLSELLDYAQDLYELAEKLILQSNLSKEKKCDLLNHVKEFYSTDHFDSMFRLDNYADDEKYLYYEKMILALKQEKEVLWGSYTEFDAAYDAKAKGDYNRAIGLYQEALEKEVEPYTMVLHAMAQTYFEMGEKKKGIECLENLLKREEVEGRTYSDYIVVELLRIFVEEKDVEGIKRYSNNILENVQLDEEHYDSMIDYYKLQIIAHYYLYEISETEEEKDKNFTICLSCYGNLKDIELPHEISDFLLTYVKTLPAKESIEEAFKIANMYFRQEWKESYECALKFFEYVERKCIEENSYEKIYVNAVINIANIYIIYGRNLSQPEMLDKALKTCVYIIQLMERLHFDDSYLYAILNKAISECYWQMDDHDRGLNFMRLCDYYLIANKECEERVDAQEKIEIWKDAAFQYRLCNNNSGQRNCLLEIINLYENYSSLQIDDYYNAVISLTYIYHNSDNISEERRILEKLFKDIIADMLKKEESTYHGYAYKFYQIANSFKEIGDVREAISLYLGALLLEIDIIKNKAEWEDMQRELSAIYPVVFEKLKRVLRMTMKPSNVDKVITCSKELRDIIGQNMQEYAELLELFAWFSKKNEYQDFEFKR